MKALQFLVGKEVDIFNPHDTEEVDGLMASGRILGINEGWLVLANPEERRARLRRQPVARRHDRGARDGADDGGAARRQAAPPAPADQSGGGQVASAVDTTP